MKKILIGSVGFLALVMVGLADGAATDPGAPHLVIPVGQLTAAPTVDGVLEEWGNEGWIQAPVHPAMENDEQNLTGNLEVAIKVGVFGNRFYLAARWPDSEADIHYKPWKWEKNQYKRGKNRDDMFAVRFQMEDAYDGCMFTKIDYRVDVWLWSAGRSNPVGMAEDLMHILSTKPLENAAEYEMPAGGMIYIRKPRDAGDAPYENSQPDLKKFQGDELPGVVYPNKGSGSAADVTAKGIWAAGYWNLEMSRLLDTGQPDDRAFTPGSRILGAVAVFNKGASEHKSVSDQLLFDFSNAF